MKTKIQHAIQAFSQPDLKTAALDFFKILGYESSKTSSLDLTVFFPTLNHDKALVNQWQSSYLLFQLADEDLQNINSSSQTIDNTIIQSYLFAAIELNTNLGLYSRTELVQITRVINKASQQPVLLLFKHGNSFTLSVIHRRINKIDNDKDVLEKVTLLKNIRISKPHPAHVDILNEFSFKELKPQPTNFVALHNAWQSVLNTKILNKQFYEKLFDWYLFALSEVKFPQVRAEADLITDEKHQSESLIRLLTRLLFVWFMKEKGLINAELFEPIALKTILKNFTGENSDDTIYYKAILQNLFFATLNMPIEKRKVIYDGFAPKDYGNQLVYRYADLFVNENFVEHFENIPFLNGGLFDCLDQKKTDNSDEIRLDGFSTQAKKQAIAPDKLFFGEYKNVDLSTAYDNKKKTNVTVYGLITILQSYKFTVEENTPLEEDIALDPELLGQVFENLLAAYNPETGTTARKQTGSFYTPREIVDYMVDESLLAYFSGVQALLARASGACTPALRLLLSYSNTENPFDETETAALICAIDKLKILDPACGSGAFPMGILHKLVFVLSKLDPKNEKWRDRQIAKLNAIDDSALREKATQVINEAFANNELDYGRKLFLIENCIHGVDIQPIAVQISKLRFFISLIVDQKSHGDKANNFGIRPLPNLDFKIIAANTLIAAPQDDFENNALFSNDDFFEKFSDLTHDYFKVANPDEKRKCRDNIETLINAKCDEKIKAIESLSHNEAKYKKQIDQLESHKKLWQSYANVFKHEAVAFFESRYFFPQLIEGFDIVIGNPPYVISNDKRLKERYAESVYGRSNLYGFFIHLSIESLMNENGILSFINPKTILADAYFSGLRKFILNHAKVSQILDINNRKDVFENVLQSVIVNFYSKKSEKTKVKNISTKDEILLNNHIFISQEDMIFDDKNTSIFIVSKHPETYKIFKRLKVFPSFQEAGIKFTTGKIQWDLYKKYLSDSPANDCTQLIWAENIQRFFLQPAKLRADKIYLNTLIDDKILIKHQTIVVQRTTAVEQSYRIIATIIDPLSFGYSIQTENNTSYIEKTNPDLDLKFILSLLNSRFYDFIFRHINSNTHVSGGELNSLPIPKIPTNQQQPFIQLVNKILTDKKAGNDTSALEREIDGLVYALYGLNEEEILIVEGK